ncbi:hypothetical protein CW304_19255 [Bacillus sp. UFRGS-B20]|nr:hypothetical protein CW304_19255 [Bacillus sp. UFRGS-B20]
MFFRHFSQYKYITRKSKITGTFPAKSVTTLSTFFLFIHFKCFNLICKFYSNSLILMIFSSFSSSNQPL